MGLLLRGATIVDVSGSHREDLCISDGKIIGRGKNLLQEEHTVEELAGKMIFPALVDSHVHFRQPGYEVAEEWTTAAKAALAGGVTAVLDMPNNKPITDSVARLQAKEVFARGCGVDFGFFVAATSDNVKNLASMVPPAIGVKLFCSETTGVNMAASVSFWREVLSCGQIVAVHAEDGRLLEKGAPRSESVVLSCLRDLLPAALEVKARVVICHVTSPAELELIGEYRQKGLEVYAEVTPHHLFLSMEDELGPWGKVNPPLRSRAVAEGMVKALANEQVDLVGSDHAPHPIEKKEGAAPPSGMPGVSTTLPVLLTLAAKGKISYEIIPKVTCQQPAEIYGLSQRGNLSLGSEATLVVVDPQKEWSIKKGDIRCGKCAWSPYTKKTFTGKAEATMLRGRFLFKDEQFLSLSEEGVWLNVS